MAWWPFGRKRREAEQAVAAAAAAPVPAAPQPPRLTAPVGEWRHLERSLTPAVATPPLVAPLERITAKLAATSQPVITADPLGHTVSREAPRGAVLGVLTPTGVAARPSTRPTMEVRRRPQATPDEPAVLRWNVPSTPPIDVPTAAPSPLPPRPARPLPAKPAVIPAAAAPSPATTGTRPQVSVEAPVAVELPAAPVEERPTVGAAPKMVHRRRLGEPLAHRPATMVAGTAVTSDLPGAVASPAVPRLPPTPPSAAATVRGMPAPLAHRAAVVPRRATAPAPATNPEPAPPARRPAGAAPPSLRPAPRTAPLSSERPIAPRHRPAAASRPAGPVEGPLPIAVPVPAAAPRVASVRRASPATPPAPAPPPATAPPTSQEVPADLRRDVERVVGTDLSGVRVHRSAESSAAAAQLGARAFTVGGEVHLPSEQGPLTHGQARSTLAHELTHVAQQRRGGVAAEDSATGRAMEAQAVDVARRVAAAGPIARPSTGSTAPVPLRRVAPVPSVAGLPTHGLPAASRPPRATPTVTSPGSPAPPPAPSRPLQVAAPIGAGSHRPADTEPVAPSRAQQIATEIAHSARAAGVSATVHTPAMAGVQRESLSTPPPPSPESSPAGPAPATPTATAAAGVSQLSAEELDDLAGRLYGGIQSRLRRDLLIRRERSGGAFGER